MFGYDGGVVVGGITEENFGGGMAGRSVTFVTLRKIGSSRVKFITMSRSLALRCFRMYRNQTREAGELAPL
jgi:hypothetical protein